MLQCTTVFPFRLVSASKHGGRRRKLFCPVYSPRSTSCAVGRCVGLSELLAEANCRVLHVADSVPGEVSRSELSLYNLGPGEVIPGQAQSTRICGDWLGGGGGCYPSALLRGKKPPAESG
ncbi:hypothetical protein AGIG_G18729 [Arapaima gigas]